MKEDGCCKGGRRGISSVMRVNSHDCSFCGRSQGEFRLCGGDQRTEPVWRLCARPRHPFGPPLINLYYTKRWQVAAALSAAVTTTKQQETMPSLQGQIVWRKNQLKPQLLFGRGSVGGASLREAASPGGLPPPPLREGARGRGFSQRSRLPRILPHLMLFQRRASRLR